MGMEGKGLEAIPPVTITTLPDKSGMSVSALNVLLPNMVMVRGSVAVLQSMVLSVMQMISGIPREGKPGVEAEEKYCSTDHLYGRIRAFRSLPTSA